MTELQIGLIGLGAVAVVGVMVYNTWQEYRHRKLGERILNEQHSDVLLDEAESGEFDSSYVEEGSTAPEVLEMLPSPDPSPEPASDTTPDTTAPAVFVENRFGSASDERIEPVLRFEGRTDEVEADRPSSDSKIEPGSASLSGVRFQDEAKESVGPNHLLSPVIDYVAAFEAVEPVSAYQILESQRDVLARISKPVHWIGYNEHSREWEAIVDDGASEYRLIRVGLQLVDRQGPLGESDLLIFNVAIQDLADELMAIAELPHRQPALDAAMQLDEFCASVDIQIGINVISESQVFLGTKLRALAEAAGMVIDADGRFVRCDDDGNVLYVLINQEAAGFSVESMKTMSTHGITFLLDVPRVAHGERVFNQMVDLARRFADVLRGALVDDNRRPLSEGALEPIRRQVGQYQSLMAVRSLPAGGPLAQRLFS